jgi:hypothetical protein
VFYTLGGPDVLSTCAELVKPYASGAHPRPDDVVALGLLWRRRVSALLADTPLNVPLIGWQWVSDVREASFLLERFQDDPSFATLGDLEEPTAATSMAHDQQLVSEGWQLLCVREPRLGDIASVLVTNVASTPRPRRCGSGSLASLAGVLHVNPASEWTSECVTEVLLREITHHMLWNDALRFGHYPDPIPTFALADIVPTSVDGDSVSLSRALADIVVTAEILSYRERHLDRDDLYQDSARLTARTLFTVRSLRDLPKVKNLTTGRFWRIVNAAHEVVVSRRIFK